jgi:hypothetical protein
MGIGVLPPTPLAANSIIRGYDKELRMKEALDDIYEDSKGMYVLEKEQVPNAIRMMVDKTEKVKSNNVTITMVLRLGGTGVYDPNMLIGTESRPVTKTFTIYYNIVRKAVTSPGYGPDFQDAKPYGLYEKWIDQLAQWNKDHHGWSIRQTILEQYGESLVHGRTAPFCQRNWTPNILVAGMGWRQMQVPYNTNRANYTTAIVNRIVTSGGGSLAPIVSQTLNAPNLTNANNLALENRVMMLQIGGLPGGKGWVLTMGEIQAAYLGDATWSQRNLGSLYIAKAALPDKIQNWRGVMGAYKNLLLVQDMMQPTLIISGTSEPWGMTAGYVEPGDNDQRQRGNALTRDTAFILGKASVVDWQKEALRHVTQDDDYKYVMGHGTARCEGVQMPIYDQQVPVAGTHEQYSSMVMILGLPDYI